MTTKIQKLARGLRWLILAASLVFFLFLSHFISVHAICPIGGFELFFSGLFGGGFSLAGLLSGMVITFLVMSVLSIVLRRAYCAYVCPMGAVQELFERLGKLLLPKKLQGLRVPPALDSVLRWAKYAILAMFVIGAAVWGGHWMIPGDPFLVMMGLSSGNVGALASRQPWAFAFLLAIVVSAFFLGRLFCRYFCPAGAWYALLSKLSPNHIERNEAECIGCGKCTKACPMHIDVAHLKKVTTAECLGCRECVNVCPKKAALSAPIGGIPSPAILGPVAAAMVFSTALSVSSARMPDFGGSQKHQGGSGQGNGAQWHKNGAGAQWHKASPDSGGSQGPVGFGGCSNCIACGFCTQGQNRQGV